jgi:hypothetical protein
MMIRAKPYILPIISIFIVLVGAALIFYSTAWGPWAFSDSAAYLATARNLIHGQGFGFSNPDGSFSPFTYYPPLYPLLLAIPGLLNIDLVSGARLLDVLFFAIALFVLTWGSSRFLPVKWGPFALAALLITSMILVDDFSSLMSEPSFILTGFTALVAILFFLKNDNRVVFTVSAILAGLAMLSRYIGFTFVITCILALLLFNKKPPKNRWMDALIFGILAIIPTIIAQGWVFSHTMRIANRSYAVNPALPGYLVDYIRQVIGVFTGFGWLPFSETATRIVPPVVRVLVVIAIGLFVYIFSIIRLRSIVRSNHAMAMKASSETSELKNNPLDASSSLTLMGGNPTHESMMVFNNVMFLFIICYLIGLGLSYSISTPPVAINDRMLSPLLPAIFSLGIGLLAALSMSFRSGKWLQYIYIGLIALLVVLSAKNTWNLVSRYHANGLGYTANIWHQPGLFDPLEVIPSQTKLISNDPALILFYLNRFPYDLSSDRNWVPTVDSPVFGQGTTRNQQLFREGAWLVIFLPPWEGTFGDEAQSRLDQLTAHLDIVFQGPEYQIYRYPSGILNSTP